MKTVKEIAHYAYFSMLSSEQEKDIKYIVAHDLADIENKINEHTNSKLKKIINEIGEHNRINKIDYFSKKEYYPNRDYYKGFKDAMEAAIGMVKREITKKD